VGVITYNGKTSDNLFQVERPPVYEYPERDVDVISVPGRNGDIIIDKGSYKNVNRPYEISVGSISGDFTQLVNKIVEWLHTSTKYARLEDSYEPDYYRMAAYTDGGSIENLYHMAGKTTLNFNCKPQRFLKVGDTPVTINATTLLNNPTNFIALPIITVSGSGTGILRVGDTIVNITTIQNGMIIDSMAGDAYKGTDNLNGTVDLSNKDFPSLIPGDNEISFSGGITSVSIIPKWWTI
jgi:predicted phage tail component-like protein